MYRRPRCPVNDKAEANRSHSRRKRVNKVEGLNIYMIGSRWTEKRVSDKKILPGGYRKLVRVDNQCLCQH